MLKFKTLKRKNVKSVMDYVKQNNENTCDYSQGVIYMWHDYFRYEYAIHNGMLILKVGDKIIALIPNGSCRLGSASCYRRKGIFNGMMGFLF